MDGIGILLPSLVVENQFHYFQVHIYILRISRLFEPKYISLDVHEERSLI